jgi:hypothetical protein
MANLKRSTDLVQHNTLTRVSIESNKKFYRATFFKATGYLAYTIGVNKIKDE